MTDSDILIKWDGEGLLTPAEFIAHAGDYLEESATTFAAVYRTGGNIPILTGFATTDNEGYRHGSINVPVTWRHNSDLAKMIVAIAKAARDTPE